MNKTVLLFTAAYYLFLSSAIFAAAPKDSSKITPMKGPAEYLAPFSPIRLPMPRVVSKYTQFYHKNTVAVFSNEVAMVGPRSTRHIVGAFDAVSALIVIMHDPITGNAGAVSFDSRSNVAQAINLMKIHLQNLSERKFHLYVASASGQNNPILKTLSNHIANDRFLTITESFNSYSLALNTRTNKIYTNFEVETIDIGSDPMARIDPSDLGVELNPATIVISVINGSNFSYYWK